MRCYSDLAVVLAERGNLREAADYFKAHLDYSQKTWGWEHHQTLQALWNLALMHRDLCDFAAAEVELRKA